MGGEGGCDSVAAHSTQERGERGGRGTEEEGGREGKRGTEEEGKKERDRGKGRGRGEEGGRKGRTDGERREGPEGVLGEEFDIGGADIAGGEGAKGAEGDEDTALVFPLEEGAFDSCEGAADDSDLFA